MATTARERRQSCFSLCLFIASAAYLYQVRNTWSHLVPSWLSSPLSSLPILNPLRNTTPHSSLASPSSVLNTPTAKVDLRSAAVAAGAFHNYLSLSTPEVEQMRNAYNRIGSQYTHYAQALNYSGKLDNLTRANEANAAVGSDIARGAGAFDVEEAYMRERKEGSVFRVREVFQHYERDWSEEGREERTVVFEPILRVLRDEIPLVEGRKGVKVLVPGSGLGRLAWEISELGYTSIANEYSNYMNLALRYLLDPSSTPSPNTHSIQPWAHRFSHQRTNADLFRSISFPDVTPRLNGRFHILEGDFFTIKPPQADRWSGYDYIVTLFFIDTSTNVAANLQKIYDLLKPGGKWINLGPLLWAEGGSVGLQLSLEEVVHLAGMVGFEGVRESVRGVECEYTAERRGMFKRIYEAQFWVGVKPDGEVS